VLSAYGIGLADIIAMREQAVEAPLAEGMFAGLLEPLEADARAQVEAQGVPAGRITVAHRAHLRYQGTDTAVIVGVGSLAEMTAAFEAAYSRRFSFLMRAKPIIVEAVSVEVTGAQTRWTAAGKPRSASHQKKTQNGCRCSPPGPGRRWSCTSGPRCGPGTPSTARHHRRGTGHHRGRAGLAGRRYRPR